ncbi:uncharacterized protein CMU_019210 [Cryptosporidium muris RN66]|uniref:MIP18 family-like domain-containing protein n=1 Tax=Cryptosporidium muris (strain RN66) TaxID=441375 RepID=B6ACA8_CRYMR|nr:uncharacterized protein CMU_019210 [Cryptosporidium muris RN66]EEA06164.1 hypothetical protein, conserved [Cryptosporidium muris RN66]|eukprot:XP_002140513.1 hypothetical protein [Cryptosporidium muris RN66]
MENLNPIIYFQEGNGSSDYRSNISIVDMLNIDDNNLTISEITPMDIFEIIRRIKDPEYPLTLEQLNVVELKNISVDNNANRVIVYFTPTITSCSQASLIGLSILFKLTFTLPSRFKVIIKVTPGSYDSEEALNKQMRDKERVRAALENMQIFKAITRGIVNSDIWDDSIICGETVIY